MLCAARRDVLERRTARVVAVVDPVVGAVAVARVCPTFLPLSWATGAFDCGDALACAFGAACAAGPVETGGSGSAGAAAESGVVVVAFFSGPGASPFAACAGAATRRTDALQARMPESRTTPPGSYLA
jgi:hypothetical protein